MAARLGPTFRHPELRAVDAGEHHQGRRNLALGMFSKPAVPGMGKSDIGTMVWLAAVDDQNEQVTFGGGRHRPTPAGIDRGGFPGRPTSGSPAIRSIELL